jgi:hypothetical protein
MKMAYNYTKLYTLFARMIKAKMGLTMIELNGNGKQPAAPFVAFDIVSPRIPITWLEDEDAFECVVSFTVYAKSKVQAMTLCDQLRDMLGKTSARDQYDAAGVVLVERTASQVRYVEETETYAYMVGFDARLRIADVKTDDVGEITEIKAKESLNG